MQVGRGGESKAGAAPVPSVIPVERLTIVIHP